MSDYAIAYVDGSNDTKTMKYSCGVILIEDGNETHFNKAFDNEYNIYRNVAGEVMGAAFIINYCIKKGIKELTIYYDYLGIEMWYTNQWKANNDLTIKYKQFAVDCSDKIKVNFIKVKSHSKDEYNDKVDMLAKKALGLR